MKPSTERFEGDPANEFYMTPKVPFRRGWVCEIKVFCLPPKNV